MKKTLLLIDFSQIVFSNTLNQKWLQTQTMDINLLRHIILNNIQFYMKKFNTNIKDIILCFDNTNYWRKKIFIEYKQNRKKTKEKDILFWKLFYEKFNQIKNEFVNELPFYCLDVDCCEADDLIAIISEIECNEKNIIVLSSDKDLLQIQNYCNNIKQWSPIRKQYITMEDQNYNFFEHIIRGDKGDGIPNILSDNDVFINKNKRNKTIYKTKIKEWEQFGINKPEYFCESLDILEKFKRNKCLIDLQMIPFNIKNDIIQKYHELLEINNTKKNIFNYLIKYELKKLLIENYFI